MKKLEHIGIAVKNAEASGRLFSRLLGIQPYKTETVESEGVSTVFFMLGDTKIELLQATNPESPIAKFIEKKGEGIHHIAIAVDSVTESMETLKDKGFDLINSVAKAGADNKNIAFLHPKSTNGVLVEICSERDEAS